MTKSNHWRYELKGESTPHALRLNCARCGECVVSIGAGESVSGLEIDRAAEAHYVRAHNPFLSPPVPGYPQAQKCDATSRIEAVAKFSLEQCQDAFGVPDLQRTVRAALERRVRALKKAGAA